LLINLDGIFDEAGWLKTSMLHQVWHQLSQI